MTRTQRRLKEVTDQLSARSEELLEIHRKAEDEDRGLTQGESKRRRELRAAITDLKAKAENLRGEIDGDEQINSLGRSLARPEAGVARSPGWGGGWDALAGEIDLKAGKRQARVPLAELIASPRPMASLDPSPGPGFDPLGFGTVRAPVAPFAEDTRYLYPNLVQEPIGEGVYNVQDFRETGTESVTGDPERDPFATTAKAELDLTITSEPEGVKQLAVTVSGVPNAVLLGERTMLAFLRLRMAALLNRELDGHVLAQIAAADPPNGGAGANIVEQLRQAKADARESGANPTIAAVGPDDAVALDLHEKSTGAGYSFPLGVTGGSSPLFGMSVIETAQVDDPLVIDPILLGVLYIGMAKLDVDSSGDEFKANLSTVRLEFSALYHVRQPTGAVDLAAS